MAYQLTERPHRIAFSNNPIRYVFNISNPDTLGSAMDIELYTIGINESLFGNDDGVLVTKQLLYPNPDGTVYFYCEDFLNSFLDWELPALLTNDIIAVKKQIRKYYIKYRQVTKGNPSPEWATERFNQRIVLKGGIAKEKFDRNNFFINYLPGKKPFLTWQPQGHFIGQEERRYLTYLHDDDLFGNVPNLVLKARVVYTDGAEDVTQLNFPSLNDSILFHVPAGLQQLGLYNLQPDKQVWYYDVSVEDQFSEVYAAPYRLYADYHKYYDVFSFIYHNSLGGFDTLRIRGDYDIEITVNSTEIQQATGGDFGTILPTENATINISKYETFTGDAGWMNTRAQQEACQELLLSDGIYRVVNNRWLKVMNLQKTQPMGAKEDTKWSFPLKWRYTFDNSQFTPSDLDFGAGVNDEAPGLLYGTCTAPSTLFATLVVNNLDGNLYRFTWNAVVNALGYVLGYKKNDADVWTEGEVTDPTVDINFTDPGEYSWRVRTQCGEEDYSGYTYGAGFEVVITAKMCSAPDSVSVMLLSLDGDNATVKFFWPAVAGVFGYVLYYKEFGTPDYAWNAVPVSTNSYTIVLKKDSQYQYKVLSNCNGQGDFSGFVYGDNFVPSAMVGSCNGPTNLSVRTDSAISQQTYAIYGFRVADFSWTNAAGVDSYEIQLRVKGTTTWYIQNNIQSVYSYSVPPGQTIEWRLRSNCTGGGFSNFVNGPDFNT